MSSKEEIIEDLQQTILKKLNELDTEKDKQARLDKLNLLYNLHRILLNYDKLEPTLKKFFKEEELKRKYNIDESWDSISK